MIKYHVNLPKGKLINHAAFTWSNESNGYINYNWSFSIAMLIYQRVNPIIHHVVNGQTHYKWSCCIATCIYIYIYIYIHTYMGKLYRFTNLNEGHKRGWFPSKNHDSQALVATWGRDQIYPSKMAMLHRHLCIYIYI